MCLKEDSMKNRELNPAYNLQVASNSQFVIAYDIFPNPTDTRTLIPFLNSMEILDQFKIIVADAGYGSEENYHYLTDILDKAALIPYAMYHKEQKKKYRTDETKRHNWHYDSELDCYVDHQGVQFSFTHYRETTDKYGYTRDVKIYTADKVQANEELDKLAKTPSNNQRKIEVNRVWESYKQCVKEALASESGSRIYAQRKIDVETVFGRMKRNFGVRRVHVRGSVGVRNDIGLLLLSMNLTKLAKMIASFSHLFYTLSELNVIMKRIASFGTEFLN